MKEFKFGGASPCITGRGVRVKLIILGKVVDLGVHILNYTCV